MVWTMIFGDKLVNLFRLNNPCLIVWTGHDTLILPSSCAIHQLCAFRRKGVQLTHNQPATLWSTCTALQKRSLFYFGSGNYLLTSSIAFQKINTSCGCSHLAFDKHGSSSHSVQPFPFPVFTCPSQFQIHNRRSPTLCTVHRPPCSSVPFPGSSSSSSVLAGRKVKLFRESTA